VRPELVAGITYLGWIDDPPLLIAISKRRRAPARELARLRTPWEGGDHPNLNNPQGAFQTPGMNRKRVEFSARMWFASLQAIRALMGDDIDDASMTMPNSRARRARGSD
jgi:hypothetical protein